MERVACTLLANGLDDGVLCSRVLRTRSDLGKARFWLTYVLMQKRICKHKGLIPDSMLRRVSRFDLAIDKGDNTNTLVPTTAIRPDATTKRYSRGT